MMCGHRVLRARRYAHSAVSFRGLIYVFGGYGGNDEWLSDLWVLDTQVSATTRISTHSKRMSTHSKRMRTH